MALRAMIYPRPYYEDKMSANWRLKTLPQSVPQITTCPVQYSTLLMAALCRNHYPPTSWSYKAVYGMLPIYETVC